MTYRPNQRTTRELLEDYGTDDVRATDWYRFVAELRTLRADGQYRWAEATLAGLEATVEATQRVTPRQRQTVARILAVEYAPSRAYDAYGRGRRW